MDAPPLSQKQTASSIEEADDLRRFYAPFRQLYLRAVRHKPKELQSSERLMLKDCCASRGRSNASSVSSILPKHCTLQVDAEQDKFLASL